MNRTNLWAAAALTLTLAAVGCNCGANPTPVGGGGGEGGGSIEDAGGGGGGGTDQCTGVADPCLQNPGICPVDCSPNDFCDSSNGNWLCGCTCADGGTIDGGIIENDAGTGGGTGGGAGGGGGAAACTSVNPCGLCPSNCTAADSCDNNVWSCACSCADGGTVDAGTIVTDGGVSPSSICLDVAKKQCSYMVRCKADQAGSFDFRLNQPQGATGGSRGNNVQIATGEEDTCVRFLSQDPNCVVGAAGWDAGRATINQTAYFDCIDTAFPAASCDRDLNQVLSKCSGTPFIGPAATNGQLCVGDGDCVNGFCSTTGNACGTCQPYLGTTGGSPNCNRNTQCDPASAYCPAGGGQRCTPYVALNGTCTNILGNECGPGHVCSGTIFGAKTCIVGKAEGATCTKNSYECLRDTVKTGVPQLICGTTATGDKCVKLESAKNGVCGTGETVIFSIQPFSSAPGPFCTDSQYCNQSVCTDKRPAGQPCSSDDVCAFGTHCVNSFCVAYAGNGQSCAGNPAPVCDSLLSCQGTTCQPEYATTGESCNTNVPCVNVDSTCQNGTCVARGANG
ncbi:MAG: hypothetical protein ACJ790_22715, partial [Myxococcaceae bacterium]